MVHQSYINIVATFVNLNSCFFRNAIVNTSCSYVEQLSQSDFRVSFVEFTAEFGDYDPVEHTVGLISEFRFVPQQTEELEMGVLEWYKMCR